MNTTNGYNLALQRQLVDSKINDISDLKQKLEFSKIGSVSDGMSVTRQWKSARNTVNILPMRNI